MIARILISTALDHRVGEIEKILSSVNLSKDHPDVLYFPADTKLGIEQARQAIDHFSMKPYQANGRIVLLEDASTLTIEAQNALLKTLEELPEEALFILGANSDANFLPTILSRCKVVTLKHDTDLVGRSLKTYEVYSKDIGKLLQSNIAERFEYIEKLKDKQEFLHTLVQYFHQDLNVHPRGGNIEFIKELITAEEWAAQNVNIRGILEYLMLVMPKE